MTTPFLVASIFLLGLSSLTTAANFTQVFESNEIIDFEWPSEEIKSQVLEDGTFKPEHMYPIFMAVYGTRIFFSLYKIRPGTPVTLVSLPTSNASSAPPKLTPFPSWDMHKTGDCNKIEEAKGLEVDSVGRLWVLDEGSYNCNCKIWTIDLIKNDHHTKLIHRFSFLHSLHDLVLDETPNGTFAYIARRYDFNIVVFSLERNQSWIVDTPGKRVNSIALSPKNQEARTLYLYEPFSKELNSISVAEVRKGTRTANPKAIGNWSAETYRMLMDNRGTIYATFWGRNFINSWNTSQPFEVQRFYEDAGLELDFDQFAFTFALDQSETLWMTVLDWNRQPKYRLLKAAVGAKSYIFEASQVSE
ncbi:protein yellow-like isoform X2 [Cloeon dipterum]